MVKYILILTIAFAASYGQIALKKAVSPPSVIGFGLLLNTNFILGIALYGFCSVSWLFVLKSMPLSVAYPFLALTFIIVPIFSWLFLGESISHFTLAGSFLILIGLALVTSEIR